MNPIRMIQEWIKAFMPKHRIISDYNQMVSRLKQLEMQVAQSSQQLELAKASFLKNIYHEIRTPLNSIIGFTNLLDNKHLLAPEEREEYTNLINVNSRKFLSLLDDIIQASLLEAGMIKIKPEPVCLGEFFDENHSFYSIRRHTQEKNAIALLLTVEEDIKQKSFVFDRYRIAQVLTQLVDNALKYTDKGVVEYGCTIQNERLEFFVKDNAIPILMPQKRLLFKKFSKLEVSKTNDGGLGLGLSICKDLLQLMEGDILVESNHGHGNTFIFSIPAIISKDENNLITEPIKESRIHFFQRATTYRAV
ncbi:MAG: hypothetical protein IPM71_13580 [Bacteroidota bacterium]|nr:MAG: hypothetical protein IPM71_13580 [Bacteroidota bacterium]